MPRTGLTAAEIRNKAIEAAVAQMRAEGFDKVRITGIARQLGVSHAALYAHFEDRTALLDAISERWLAEIDATLAAICRKPGKDPAKKLRAWMIALHRAKLAKVTELYKSFDLLAHGKKPYVQRHMETMRAQLLGLVGEAIAKRRLRDADPERMVDVIWEAMMAFHHPKLVAQHLGEEREPLLEQVLSSVLRGLDLEG
jgi:AcrR family transcriptional regulator